MMNDHSNASDNEAFQKISVTTIIKEGCQTLIVLSYEHRKVDEPALLLGVNLGASEERDNES